MTGFAKWFSVLATALAVCVGVDAAVRLDEIKRGALQFPVSLSNVAVEATIFWTLFIVCIGSSLLAAIGTPSTDDLRKLQRQHELQRRLTVITALVNGLADDTEAELRGVEHDPRAGVRVVLRALCELAWLFDGKPRGVRYAANVMTFVPSGSISSHTPEVKFRDADVELVGVLALDPRLSCVRDKRITVDPELHPFSLPVPKAVETPDGRILALPGAPRAYLTMRHAFFLDAQEMLAWSEAESGLRPHARTELSAYLSSPQGRFVQSFCAVPLFQSDFDESPTWVVNLHRDKPGLLSDLAEDWAELAHFFQRDLVRQLARVQKRDQAIPQGS